jgi:uncharacterized GH25 family protein
MNLYEQINKFRDKEIIKELAALKYEGWKEDYISQVGVKVINLIDKRIAELKGGNMTKCELCGSQVKVVGDVTKHYEPAVSKEDKKIFIETFDEAINELHILDKKNKPAQKYVLYIRKKLEEL